MLNYTLGQPFLPSMRIFEDPFMDEFRDFPVKETIEKKEPMKSFRQNMLNKKFGFRKSRYVIHCPQGLIMHPNQKRLLEKTVNDSMVKRLEKETADLIFKGGFE